MRRNWFRNRLGRKNSKASRRRTIWKPRNVERSFFGAIESLEDRRLLSVSVSRTGSAPNYVVTFTDNATAPVNNQIVLRFNTGTQDLEYSLNGAPFTNDLDSAPGTQNAAFNDIATINTILGPGADNLVLNLQTFAFNARVVPQNANPLVTVATLTDSGGGHAVDVNISGTQLVNFIGVGGNDNLRVESGNGDNTVSVQNGSPIDTDELNASDIATRIQFTDINGFTYASSSIGTNVVTFATNNLQGATTYSTQLDDLDTLIAEGSNADDSYTISKPAAGQVQISDNFNSHIITQLDSAGRPSIQINTLDGFDRLTVDAGGTGGPVQNSILYDGGAGNDALFLTGGSASVSTYNVAATPGTGSSVIVFPSAVQIVHFVNLEPVIDDVTSDNAVVNATDANNSINYTSGGFNGQGGLVTVDAQEAYYFINKTHLVINSFAGDDVINLNNPDKPTGLADILVSGDDPTASDTVIVNGTDGADIVTIDALTIDGATVTGAGPVPITVTTTEHLIYSGQGGDDDLTITTPSGIDVIHVTPGALMDQAQVDIRRSVAAGGGPFLSIAFTGLGANGSLTFDNDGGTDREDVLGIEGTAGSNVFEVDSSGDVDLATAGALNQVQTLVTVHTPGIFVLNLNGLAGDDTFMVDADHPFDGLFVDGGDPSASDVLNFAASGTTANLITADFGAATVQEATFAAVDFTGIEILNVDANGHNFTVRGTAGNDVMTVTPTATDAITAQLNSSAPSVGSTPVINASNIGAFNVDLLGGSDKLIVKGTQGGDSIDVNNSTANAVKVGSLEVVNYNSSLAALEVDALAGNDTIDVKPSSTTAIFVDGGDPIGSTPGDTIKLHPTSFFFVENGPEKDEGGLRNLGTQRVSWDHIERRVIIGGGGGGGGSTPGLVQGTGWDDDITIIARDSSYDPAADGKQDFTVTVNDGPDDLYIDVPVFFVDALAGDDDIVVREPAPNNAVWNVQLYIAGGTPEAPTGDQGDVVELETPGTQSVSYAPAPAAFTAVSLPAGVTLSGTNPGGLDTALVTDSTNTSTISITPFKISIGAPFPPDFYLSSPGGAEQFVYQGDGGGDSLTYVSPPNSNNGSVINYTPGATQDSGAIAARRFNGDSVMPFLFYGIGFNGAINFTGTDSGRHDRLVVSGTASGDVFEVDGTAAAGAGTVRERRNNNGNTFTTQTLTTTSIRALELDGLGGVDVFNVKGGLPYDTTDVEGNDPILNLSGATGAVTVSLGDNTAANQFSTITGYGGTISLIGIDQANLDLNTHSLTVTGTGGDDTINFTPSSATAGSFIATTTGPVVATSPQFTYSGLSTGITVNGGNGFDLIGLIATAGNDVINAVQNSATSLSYTQNAFTVAFTVNSIDGANLSTLAGDDLIRVSVTDTLELTTPAAALRFDVDGGPPNASDRLVVNDDGLGDLILWRQANDQHSGSIVVGAFAPVVYNNIERVDITPLDPITGATGTDKVGRIKVFHTDPFEFNDSLPNAAELQRIGASPTSPNIDPGGITQPFQVPGDDDWYVFRPQATGTFQVKIVFSKLPTTLSNGHVGLPGTGDLDLDIYDANGVLITSGAVTPQNDGKFAIFAATNDPAFANFNTIYVRVHGHTADSINTYDFDNIAALITGLPGVSAVDLEGPQVTDVRISDPNTPPSGTDGENLNYNLFGLKPGNAPQGPTPLVNAITINFRDLPARFPGFLYPALDYMLTPDQARGLFEVRGDANGIVAIKEVRINNDPVSLGAPPGNNGTPVPTGEIQIIFEQPLPDDRFTLSISDSLRDPAQNRLDGESNADEPNNGPFFPSGDGHSGGDFVARFTIDTRPELGDFAAARVYIDINGNSLYDPQNLDFTNRDLTFTMQLDPTLVGRAQLGVHDSVFAGNFAGVRGVADGFSKLGVYGTDPVMGPGFRWLLDTDDNGTGDLLSPQATGFTMFDQNGAAVTFNGSGIAFAGNFDGFAANGDEVGLFDSTHFFLDTNHNFVIDAGDTVITTALRGFPIVGDFNGDGTIDLGTWQTDVFQFNFGTPGTGGDTGNPVQFTGFKDAIINFGFPGVGEIPLAADMDMDGITDIGLWVPGHAGTTTQDISETFFLVSHDFDPSTAQPRNTGLTDPGAAFTLLNHAFAPTPLGNDLYSNFLDEFATPIVGNFDPPVVPASAAAAADNVAPASSVSALAATQTSRSFTVSWSGTDGSGIAGYDIYVSDNGGNFTRWQSGTTSTSAAFTGVNGHAYSFFSIATDNAGNVQATPTAAQASTSIQVRALTTTVLASSSSTVVPGQTVTFTATVSAIDSSNPTPTGTVTFKDGSTVLGTVALVGGNATFTAASLSSGNHNITATYNAQAPSVGSISTTLVEHVVSAALEPNPNNPSLAALFIGGSSGNDIITLSFGPNGVTVTIKTNSKTTSLGTFNPPGGVFVFGLGGTDTLVGPNYANDWNITGVNSGTLNGNPFNSIENITGGSLADVFRISGGSLSGAINGAAGADTIVAANQANTWNISNSNAGKLNATSFSAVENLIGGSQNDNFVLARAKGVTGRIDGGAGINMLDYAAYITSVNVNLAAGTATNISGGIGNISVVRGGSAADTITGDNGNDVLIGGAGNDKLTAGSGHNLLFGGLGADTLGGGNGENIMFAGTTTFDTNLTTIDNLLAYWSRTDLDYATRVAALKAGSATGAPQLSSTTVKNDTVVNTLNGGSGLDWFFAKLGSPKDTINNQITGEQVN